MSETNPNEHLHVIHTLHSGAGNSNSLPTPPEEGRKLVRVWTLINKDLLKQLGPVHNVSAFLEDHIHDWQITRDGGLRYYSRIAETNTDVEVVLDYETHQERRLREALRAKVDTPTGKPNRQIKP